MSLMPVVLEVAIVKLNWYKSPVIDQILVAVMQVQHESLCYEIQELNAVFVLKNKKGDKTGCSKLLSDTYRNLLHILLSVLSLYVVCKGKKQENVKEQYYFEHLDKDGTLKKWNGRI